MIFDNVIYSKPPPQKLKEEIDSYLSSKPNYSENPLLKEAFHYCKAHSYWKKLIFISTRHFNQLVYLSTEVVFKEESGFVYADYRSYYIAPFDFLSDYTFMVAEFVTAEGDDLHDLDINTKIINILFRKGIRNILTLTKWDEDSLLQERGFGLKSLKQLKKALEKYNARKGTSFNLWGQQNDN